MSRLRLHGWGVVGAVACAFLAACPEDQLARRVPLVKIVPVPTDGQTTLENPAGIDLGSVPLYSVITASFSVENESGQDLEISSAQILDLAGGNVVIKQWPEAVPARENRPLVVTFEPLADQQQGSATIALTTNAGQSGDEIAQARVVGVGKFVGAPNLELCYLGECHGVPESCDATVTDRCQLPALPFGNVALESTASQAVRLRNSPPSSTCRPPPGAPVCTPACVVTFRPDSGAFDMGLGFEPANVGFNILGNMTIPFQLAPREPTCEGVDDIIRGDLPLLVSFKAGATEELNVQSSLILESNDPAGPVVELPLFASARKAPVAVATLRVCGENGNIAPNCSVEDEIRPLGDVNFDGSASYDPDGKAIADYWWSVVDMPNGADKDFFGFDGQGTTHFRMSLPLAGEYTVRLQVTNEDGIASGVSATSDVTFTAVPDSRLHVQVVWDNPDNDIDLHLVNVGANDLVFHARADCFWKNCRPKCQDDPDHTSCAPLVQWDSDFEALKGSNPRLDIDDTEGLGPENINIDRPHVGLFAVYAHYYGLVSTVDEPTQVVVRIYLDGALKGDYRRLLRRHDLWRVADIDWNDEAPEAVPTTSDGDGVGAVRQDVYFGSWPTGYDFGPTR